MNARMSTNRINAAARSRRLRKITALKARLRTRRDELARARADLKNAVYLRRYDDVPSCVRRIIDSQTSERRIVAELNRVRAQRAVGAA